MDIQTFFKNPTKTPKPKTTNTMTEPYSYLSLNGYVLRKIYEFFENQDIEIDKRLENKSLELKAKGLDINGREYRLEMHKESVSISQSNKSKFGAFFEEITMECLKKLMIPFTCQVPINEKGMVCLRGKQNGCIAIIDIVAGNVVLNQPLTDCIALSCKTTCRERYKQDLKWSIDFPPKLYLFVMAKGDYPPLQTFIENSKRKILACCNFENDDRNFQLNFDDLLNEIQQVL